MKNPAAVSPGPTGSIISGREPYGEVIHFQSLYRSVVGRNRIRDRAPGRRNDRGRRANAPLAALAVAGLDSGNHEAIGGKDSIALVRHWGAGTKRHRDAWWSVICRPGIRRLFQGKTPIVASAATTSGSLILIVAGSSS